MRAIRSKDMRPELAVRSLAYKLGYRFRLHRKDLPRKPVTRLGIDEKSFTRGHHYLAMVYDPRPQPGAVTEHRTTESRMSSGLH